MEQDQILAEASDVALEQNTNFLAAMAAGAVAGLCVDVSLFPLDTIKTRLQSPQGFLKSGGFKGVYSGLGSAATGSMPGAALFFCTYEVVKAQLAPHVPQKHHHVNHMLAASCGEVVGCVVRVPTEVIKQRAQSMPNTTSLKVFRSTLTSEGPRGFFRGYTSTVIREVPFSFIQFPLWEYFKTCWASRKGAPISPVESGLCGSLSGSIAASITTPLDVAKTRIMLEQKGGKLARGNIYVALCHVFRENGIRGLYAGVVPRTMWISIGGAIFLGTYDLVKGLLNRNSHSAI